MADTTSLLPPDEQAIQQQAISGKPLAAPTTPPPTGGSSASQLPPDEQAAQAQALRQQATVSPPAQPPPATPPYDPWGKGIYSVPGPFLPPAQRAQELDQAGSVLRAVPSVALPAISQGLREAVSPLLEFGSNIGNRLAAYDPSLLGWMQTNRAGNDAAAQAAFNQRFPGTTPQSQAAQGVAALTATAAPVAIGGTVAKGLQLGTEAAGIPTVGRFLTGSAGEGSPGVTGALTRLGSRVTGGAVQGTVAGGGPGAVAGATIGGVALPIAGSAADWFTRRFGSGITAALQKIQQAVQRDGMTPQQLQNAVQQLGPLATLADVEDNANLRGLAEGVANAPGPGQQTARQFLATRSEGQTQRMNAAVRSATGATGSAYDTMQDLQDARRTTAAPAYANAFENTVVSPEQAKQLEPFINSPIGQRALQNGIANAQLQALEDGTPFKLEDLGVKENDDGSYELVPGTPNLRLYDAVKRGFDVLAEDFRDPVTGRLNLSGTRSVPGMGGQIQGSRLQGVRQAFTSQLRSMFPDYAAALDSWAGPSADMDALSMGRRVLSADPDVTTANVARLAPSQQQMYRVGVAQALQDKIAGTPDDADATRRLFGNDLIRSKIAAGFGGENTPEFQSFQNTMEREATFAATQRQLLHGSPTARRAAAIEAAAQPAPPAHLAEPLLHAATGNLPAAGWSLVRMAGNPLLGWATQPNDRVNAALGQYLFNPATQSDLFNRLQSGVPSTMRNQLMNWQAQQALQAVLNRERARGQGQ